MFGLVREQKLWARVEALAREHYSSIGQLAAALNVDVWEKPNPGTIVLEAVRAEVDRRLDGEVKLLEVEVTLSEAFGLEAGTKSAPELATWGAKLFRVAAQERSELKDQLLNAQQHAGLCEEHLEALFKALFPELPGYAERFGFKAATVEALSEIRRLKREVERLSEEQRRGASA